MEVNPATRVVNGEEAVSGFSFYFSSRLVYRVIKRCASFLLSKSCFHFVKQLVVQWTECEPDTSSLKKEYGQATIKCVTSETISDIVGVEWIEKDCLCNPFPALTNGPRPFDRTPIRRCSVYERFGGLRLFLPNLKTPGQTFDNKYVAQLICIFNIQ